MAQALPNDVIQYIAVNFCNPLTIALLALTSKRMMKNLGFKLLKSVKRNQFSSELTLTAFQCRGFTGVDFPHSNDLFDVLEVISWPIWDFNDSRTYWIDEDNGLQEKRKKAGLYCPS